MWRTKWNKWAVCLLVLISICICPVAAAIPSEVYPGGMPFGIKFACDGLVVVGFTEVVTEEGVCMPAFDAGLRVNDIIFRVNGEKVYTSADFAGKIENCGDSVEITYQRQGKECSTKLKPAYCAEEGKYKTGMWIRDTTAGIGTVTFIEPDTGSFAGLGHGICDQNTGELLPMRRGTVVDVTITGVSKGVSGRPGELKGFFAEKETGLLLHNRESGVYGILKEIPMDKIPEKRVPIAEKNMVETGDAYIWCTLDGDKAEKFSICITSLENNNDGKFEIMITDENLIEKTGGIVQGMSGSPILQNGRIVGAVTHVLINDPTRGYGIFIENMLEAAK